MLDALNSTLSSFLFDHYSLSLYKQDILNNLAWWSGDYHVTGTGNDSSKMVSPFQRGCFLIPKVTIVTAPEHYQHTLYYINPTLTIFLDEMNITTSKRKGKLVVFRREKNGHILNIRSFLLPRQGNMFCSCPKHWQTAGHYNRAWQNSRGWLCSYSAVDEFDVEQVETVSNKWGAWRTENSSL